MAGGFGSVGMMRTRVTIYRTLNSRYSTVGSRAGKGIPIFDSRVAQVLH